MTVTRGKIIVQRFVYINRLGKRCIADVVALSIPDAMRLFELRHGDSRTTILATITLNNKELYDEVDRFVAKYNRIHQYKLKQRNGVPYLPTSVSLDADRLDVSSENK